MTSCMPKWTKTAVNVNEEVIVVTVVIVALEVEKATAVRIKAVERKGILVINMEAVMVAKKNVVVEIVTAAAGGDGLPIKCGAPR